MCAKGVICLQFLVLLSASYAQRQARNTLLQPQLQQQQQQDAQQSQLQQQTLQLLQDSLPEASGLSSDAAAAETGFAGAVQAGSKYFQYAHNPVKDHYEVGHKRGNEHHFIEKHEKAHPHEGEFKTKVRWGDKHGGYGEHYWDYNHAGHGGDGEETQNHEVYVPYEEPAKLNQQRQKRGSSDDVEFLDEDSKAKILSGLTSKHGGNYRRHPRLERNRREQIFA